MVLATQGISMNQIKLQVLNIPKIEFCNVWLCVDALLRQQLDSRISQNKRKILVQSAHISMRLLNEELRF
jgi:hypothetical protein